MPCVRRGVADAFFLSNGRRTFAMLLVRAWGRCRPKLCHADTKFALLLRVRGGAIFLCFELFIIFAALGIGAVGVVKTVDRLLDEQPLHFNASLLQTASARPDPAEGFWKDSLAPTEQAR
jgi:hypothetical protein